MKKKGERDLIADRLAAQPHKSLALLLSWRELRIIEHRYGLSDYTPLTLAEIGIEFGICRERVRQIQNKALEKLGELLDPPLTQAEWKGGDDES